VIPKDIIITFNATRKLKFAGVQTNLELKYQGQKQAENQIAPLKNKCANL
jgi:hypothetical protein